MDIFFWAQIIGLIGGIGGILSYQAACSKSILRIGSISTYLWALHFFLLNSPAAAITTTLGASRDFISTYIPARWIPHLVISMTSISLMLIMTLDFGIYGLIAGLATISCALATLCQSNSLFLRIYHLMAEIFYLILSVAALSAPGIVFGVFGLLSSLTGAVRHESVLAPFKERAIQIFALRAIRIRSGS